ncbi:MAG TPA: hypothetical protein VNK04_23615, partial [Gemmataceae bacterium]|nr:hypothetical protein [Gemmataceae bacterium]
TADFDLFAVNLDRQAGTIRVGLGRSAGPITGRGSGSVLEITFRITRRAPAGRAVINLQHRLGVTTTQLNEGGLDLNPDPSDQAGDALDGVIRVLGRARPRLARDLAFAGSGSMALRPEAVNEFFRALMEQGPQAAGPMSSLFLRRRRSL